MAAKDDVNSPSAVLRPAALPLGILIDNRQARLFDLYYDLLLASNRKVNLTRITAAADVAIKHFLDSLTCLPMLPSPSDYHLKVVDVGAGAGFPGVPLKILRSDITLTLLDAVAKKTAFLGELVQRLGLADVKVIHGRVEDVGHDVKHRAAYDVALARALAPLPVLVEYCLPLLKLHGHFVAMKTVGAAGELAAAARAIAVLGGRLKEAREVPLPGLEQSRLLIVIQKIGVTPDQYARQAGKPAKQPLGSDERSNGA